MAITTDKVSLIAEGPPCPRLIRSRVGWCHWLARCTRKCTDTAEATRAWGGEAIAQARIRGRWPGRAIPTKAGGIGRTAGLRLLLRPGGCQGEGQPADTTERAAAGGRLRGAMRRRCLPAEKLGEREEEEWEEEEVDSSREAGAFPEWGEQAAAVERQEERFGGAREATSMTVGQREDSRTG